MGTFIVVNFAWIFFRANNLKDAFYVVTNLFENLKTQLSSIRMIKDWLLLSGFSKYSFIVIAFSILVLFFFDFFLRYRKRLQCKWPILRNQALRFFGLYVLIMVILYLGHYGSAEFIYFQF